MTDALPPDERDAEISRCLDCGEWRWRASYLACQNCGAASVAARVAPVVDLTEAQLAQRWRDTNRTWRPRPQDQVVGSPKHRTVVA